MAAVGAATVLALAGNGAAFAIPAGAAGRLAARPGRGGPAVVSLAPPSRVAVTGSALMRAQIPLQRAADAITKAATLSRSGYADITLSVPEHRVTVYWHGTMPGRITRLLARLRSASVRIVVRPARFTAAQLTAEIRRLEASRARYAARGVLLDAFIRRADGGGIAVGTATRASSRPALAAIQASLRAGSPIPLTFQPAPKITPAHRLEDLPAHWAGSRIKEGNGPASCTTGFPVERISDGRTFITTADHCDANVGHPVNEQWWDWLGPHDTNHRMGEAWYHMPSIDTAFIRPPAGSVQGVTYTGGVAESHDSSAFVSGTGGNYIGLDVCTSGSWTGQHCNIETEDLETDWIPEDNAWVTVWHGVQTLGSIASGEGDSGGPVYSAGSGGTVLAQGAISLGFGNGFSCTNDNGESTVCFFDVGWVDEQSILNQLDAFLLTG
jgi:hypothetical protein